MSESELQQDFSLEKQVGQDKENQSNITKWFMRYSSLQFDCWLLGGTYYSLKTIEI